MPTKGPAPIMIGTRVQAKAKIEFVKEIQAGQIEVEYNVTIQAEKAEKPSCVASVLYRYYY